MNSAAGQATHHPSDACLAITGSGFLQSRQVVAQRSRVGDVLSRQNRQIPACEIDRADAGDAGELDDDIVDAHTCNAI
jgi:hypothetical protein